VLNLSLNSYITCCLHCTPEPVNLHYSASSCSTTPPTGLECYCILSLFIRYCHHITSLHLISVTFPTF